MTHTERLPKNWAIAPLAELVDIQYGKNLPTNRMTDSGYPVFGANGRIGYFTDFTCEESEVLITCRGATCGTINVSLPKSYVTNNSLVLRPWAPEALARTFLRYAMLASDRSRTITGTAQPQITIANLSRHQILVAPFSEQHRIVEAIESYLTRLDAAVALLERVQQNLKRYRASVLKAAVEGRLVPTEAELARKEGRDYEPASELLKRILVERRKKWIENAAEKARAKAEEKAHKAGKPWTHADDIKTLEKERAKAAKKYKEPAAPDTSNLPDLPEGWCWATVEQLGVIASGQTPKGISEEISSKGDIPWFRVSDMNLPENRTQMLRATSCLTVSQIHALGLHVQHAGTIIFPKRGGAIMTNKKRRLVRDSAYDLNTMGLVPSTMASEYIWLWFRQLDLRSLSDGSNVPQINHSDIAPLHVPLPPFAEQPRIIATAELALSTTRVLSEGIERNVARSQRLRQSILKWAFEGKLVPQDPEDEPASVLLERIKAERESMQPRKRRRSSRQKKNEPTKQDKQLDLLEGSNT